jgi:hypothetical protein
MLIACLAFGSLLWKPAPLQLASGWMTDGPVLPLEFARVGDKGELSVVLCEQGRPCPTRWAYLEVGDLSRARDGLRRREQIHARHPEWVGSLDVRDIDGASDARIARWLCDHPVEAVVWTALPPRIDGEEGRFPSCDEAVAYLDGLSGEVRDHARDYVRRTAPEIDTPYRRAFERRLGWHTA